MPRSLEWSRGPGPAVAIALRVFVVPRPDLLAVAAALLFPRTRQRIIVKTCDTAFGSTITMSFAMSLFTLPMKSV